MSQCQKYCYIHNSKSKRPLVNPKLQSSSMIKFLWDYPHGNGIETLDPQCPPRPTGCRGSPASHGHTAHTSMRAAPKALELMGDLSLLCSTKTTTLEKTHSKIRGEPASCSCACEEGTGAGAPSEHTEVVKGLDLKKTNLLPHSTC